MSAGSPDKLVYMANQIARFFASQPGDTAGLRVADHLNSFWTRAMRQELVAHVDRGGDGLEPAALAAVDILRSASPRRLDRAMAAAQEPSGRLPGDDAG